PPTSSVGPADRHLAACRKVRLNFACLASSGSLQGDEVRDDKIILAAGRTKNKREHVVPLSDAAKTILSQFRRDGRQYVFGPRELEQGQDFARLRRRRSRQVDAT